MPRICEIVFIPARLEPVSSRVGRMRPKQVAASPIPGWTCVGGNLSLPSKSGGLWASGSASNISLELILALRQEARLLL